MTDPYLPGDSQEYIFQFLIQHQMLYSHPVSTRDSLTRITAGYYHKRMILTKERIKFLAMIIRDAGQVFFASVFVGPLVSGNYHPFTIASGFVLSLITWYFSMSLIKESLFTMDIMIQFYILGALLIIALAMVVLVAKKQG